VVEVVGSKAWHFQVASNHQDLTSATSWTRSRLLWAWVLLLLAMGEFSFCPRFTSFEPPVRRLDPEPMESGLEVGVVGLAL
jgi:hypothetical protein